MSLKDSVLHSTVLFEILNEIALAAGKDSEYSSIISKVLNIVSEKLDVEMGIIFSSDQADGIFRMAASYQISGEIAKDIEKRRMEGKEKKFGGTSAEVFKTGKTFLLEDMTKDDRFTDRFSRLSERSFVNVPCKSSTRMPLTMALMSKPGYRFRPEDVPILDAVGYQIGLILENALLFQDAKRCENEINLLYKLGMEISASLDVREVYKSVASGIMELMGTDLGLIAIEKDETHMVIEAVKEIEETRISEESPALKLNLEGFEKNSHRQTNIPIDSQLLANFVDLALLKNCGYQSVVVAPIFLENRLEGIICGANRDDNGFSNQLTNLLYRFGQKASVAVENAVLYQKVGTIAVLEERQRLAGEMHDHLAQTVGSAKMLLTQSKKLLDKKKLEEAKEIISGLEENLGAAYIDIKEMIYNLNYPVSDDREFIVVLREYLKEYEQYYAVSTNLEVLDERSLGFNENATMQLDRIIKEALTNSRKHSNANQVEVIFDYSDGISEVRIRDNGEGQRISLSEQSSFQHHGLRIMRERAASINGKFEFISSPGTGVEIVISVPLNR